VDNNAHASRDFREKGDRLAGILMAQQPWFGGIKLSLGLTLLQMT
jgi:hypothetical protein